VLIWVITPCHRKNGVTTTKTILVKLVPNTVWCRSLDMYVCVLRNGSINSFLPLYECPFIQKVHCGTTTTANIVTSLTRNRCAVVRVNDSHVVIMHFLNKAIRLHPVRQLGKHIPEYVQ